jgi:hypothetical protein
MATILNLRPWTGWRKGVAQVETSSQFGEWAKAGGIDYLADAFEGEGLKGKDMGREPLCWR